MLSVISNATLVAFKLVFGTLTGSVSIISEAIHSGIDLGAAIIALFSVRKSSLPPDTKHPFGHGKIENISGFIEAILVFVAAIWIISEAVNKLLKPGPLDDPFRGAAVMVLSVLTNLHISQRLFDIGRKSDSVALIADAWHLRTDVYTSAGVMAGLIAIWAGGKLAPSLNLQWIDPIAAMFVAAIIIKAGYDLMLQSARNLLDCRLPDHEEEWLQHLLTRQLDGTGAFHGLRTRKSGPFRFIEFHVQINPTMSIDAAHRINENLAEKIRAGFTNSNVSVHFNPGIPGEAKPVGNFSEP